MVDEKQLEAALEAEVAQIDPSPALWARIRRETSGEPVQSKARPSLWTRLQLGRRLEVVAACIVFIGLIGLAALRFTQEPSLGGETPMAWQELMAGYVTRTQAELPPEGVHLFQDDQTLRNWLKRYEMELPASDIDYSSQTVAVIISALRAPETVVKTVELQPPQAVVVLTGSEAGPPAGLPVPARRMIVLQLPRVSAVAIREEGLGEQQTGREGPARGAWLDGYTPVELFLRDYRGVTRDLTASPDDAVTAGVRALGPEVDYPSPPIHATPGYELMLMGPDGDEAVLRYVGDGNWQLYLGQRMRWVEGAALAAAVQQALAIPPRQPGDLEYLFSATELKTAQDSTNIPETTWNHRRHVVVRVLLVYGTPAEGSMAPVDGEPLLLQFTVNGRTEQVEVWANAFRYGGRLYQAEAILQMLGSNMAAG